MCQVKTISSKLVLILFTSISSLQIATCDEQSAHVKQLLEQDSWNYWWSYSGFSGPAYWSPMNTEWLMCDNGRRQSPIDIDTRSLVYDPNLGSLQLDNNLISGVLYNDGHAIVLNCSAGLLLAASADPTATNINPGNQLDDEPTAPTASEKPLSGSNSEAFQLDQLDPKLFAQGFLAGSSGIVDQAESEGQFDISGPSKYGVSSLHQVRSKREALSDGFGGNKDTQRSNLESEQLKGSEIQAKGDEVTITAPGLSYKYKFEALYIRFGKDSKSPGSEHRINSRAYTGELQLLAYNSQLYSNFFEASTRPYGLLAISLLIDLLSVPQAGQTLPQSDQISAKNATSQSATGRASFEQLQILLKKLDRVSHRGASTLIKDFDLAALLPETEHFVTYEGSLSWPSCQESVTWLLLNRPTYITSANIDKLRSISAGEQSGSNSGQLIADNIRPLQAINGRPIRTNIRPKDGQSNWDSCPSLRSRYEYREAS